MKTRQLFKRKVIEAIHWLPYEEAIEKELMRWCIVNIPCKSMPMFTKWWIVESIDRHTVYIQYWVSFVEHYINSYEINELKDKIIGLPITIWRVLQALQNKKNKTVWSWTILVEGIWEKRDVAGWDTVDDSIHFSEYLYLIWKLTKENWQECTDDDQTDETIEKIIKHLSWEVLL